MKKLLGIVLFLAMPLMAQTAPAPPGAPDPWKALSFLEGTWDAKTPGTNGVATSGSYSFKTELGGHILARHSTTDAGCKAPADFDCAHGDLLYVFQEMPGQPLKAIYFDNEGHVLHYDVTTPDATTAIFLSDGSTPGPRFRLVYERKGPVMAGKFQMQMPGQTEWKSYLEWSGAKK